jgi:predicted dehydrogenase
MSHEMKRKLRVGVVGCGLIGAKHAEAYLTNDAIDFVGLCDVSPELVQRKRAHLRCAGYGSIAELIENGRPELLSIAVQLDRSVAPVIECLEAGVHVLCEKPIAFDPSDILRLINLAQRRGLKLGVNFNMRFTQPSQWFRRLRESGAFGQMLSTTCSYNQGSGAHYYSLREHMIHQFDFWRYHLGEVASVTAQARWSNDPHPHPGHPLGIAATIQFVEGALGAFTNGYDLIGGVRNHYELVGSKGRGFCRNLVGPAEFRPNEGPVQVQPRPWIDAGGHYWDTFAAHLEQVVAAVANDQPLPIPAVAAFEAQCLCSAVVEALESGVRVDVPPMRKTMIDAAL